MLELLMVAMAFEGYIEDEENEEEQKDL